MIKRIDHIGVVVGSIRDMMKTLSGTLGFAETMSLKDPQGQFRSSLLEVNGACIELVEPLTDEGPVARFFRERGNCLHHLSLEVEDIEGVVTLLAQKGIRLVNQKPEIVGEMKTIFVHPGSTGGLLVELVEKNPKK
ncbi:MAG: VOC family protein [Syntrophorhabdales bacterium]|jgi:methylmalonyl-CoA epimerase